jgi:hypothetical protein
VTRPGEYDSDFFTPPQLERSGAEFVFKLCGCEPFSILSTSVPDDTVFSEGDTWEIRGRFFERTSGFNGISLMTCPPQRYTPLVTLRFSHNMSSDTTTVSMVYATDQTGAAMLAGLASDPPINSEVGCDGDEGSVHEALSDVVVGATIADGFGWGTVELPTRVVSEPWANRGPLAEFLDPTDWRAFVLIGTTYSRSITVPSADGAEFVWSDASGVHSGDMNGDGQTNVMDRTVLQSFISANDLIDGVMNGRVPTDGFSVEFFLQDLNYDGFVDCTDMADLGGSGCCPADWNGEDGLTLQDLFDFLEAWFGGQADFNTDGQTSIQDIFDFLTAYFLGCS